MRPPVRLVVITGAALGLALAALGWIDYRAVSQELRRAVQGEASALHSTIAAAAQAHHAAARQAEAALGQRLLENARLLAELDRREALTPAMLDGLAERNDFYRIVVFAPDGSRESVAGGPGRGNGLGRQGDGSGPGWRRGGGEGPQSLGGVAQRLLTGGESEVVASPHSSRRGDERLAAGVRRAGGGAIVLNAASRTAQQLEEVYSFDALLTQIARATSSVAYISLREGDRSVARGPLAPGLPGDEIEQSASESTRVVSGEEVLERVGPIALDDTREAELRIGMRLAGVISGERRTLARLGIGLSAIAAVTIIALAFVSLRQRYGELSERHATVQEALRRRDRLATMGEMASTVAHEIRNPLNAIAMSAQRLVREYPAKVAAGPGTEDSAEELVSIIQREASRIDTRVQQFLEFARPRPLNLQETPLEAPLAQSADALRATAAARDVKLVAEIEAAPTIHVDRDQLRHVVDNLLRNAIEATGPGGTVILSAGRERGGAFIEVRDTGEGIPADVLPRIFDLYFTTKRNGTGVGLAVSHQIVTAHGGTIDVESQPGQGTRMLVRLPERSEHGG